jgi:hypothetical protein
MPDSSPEVTTLCDGDPLARALASLRPTPTGLDPTHVVYLAGQAARDRAVTFWRRAFLAQGVAIVALGCLAVLHFTRLAELDRQLADTRSYRQPTPPAPTLPPEPEPAPMPREAVEPYPPDRTGSIARTGDEPTAEERAKWLQLRNDVLAGGLGVLPTPARPQPTPADWRGFEFLRGAYAVHPPAPTPPKKPDLPPE